MNYPPKALRDSLEGRVDVECIVDTLGFTINHKIIRGVRQDIPPDVKGCKATHKRQECPPYRLRSLLILFSGGTSRCFCEVEVCFFKARPIAVRLTGSSRTTRHSSSKRRRVQRARPSGAGPQAICIMRASVRPSTFVLEVSEFGFRLIERTSSKPPAAYALTTFLTVLRDVADFFPMKSYVDLGIECCDKISVPSTKNTFLPLTSFSSILAERGMSSSGRT